MAKAKTKSKKKGEKKESTLTLERFFESVGPQREKTVIEHAQAIIQTAAKNGSDMLRLRDKVNLGEAPKRGKGESRKPRKSDKGIQKLFDDFSAGMPSKMKRAGKKGAKREKKPTGFAAIAAHEKAEMDRWN